MTTDKREVELIIKGTNLGGKTIKEASDSVKRLSGEIEKQVVSAKKGEGSLNDLKKSYAELDAVGKKLIGQDALVGLFKRTAQAVEDSRIKVARAKTEYEALAEQQSFMGKVSRDQDRELRNLLKTVTASEREFARLDKSLGTVTKQLATAGIDTRNLDQAQETLVASAREQVAAYAAAGKAIENYDKYLKEAEATERQLADNRLWEQKVADAAKARQATDYVNFWNQALEKADAEEKALADNRLWEQKVADAAKARQASEYVNFWNEALDKADLHEKALADNQLWDKKVADAAKVRKAAQDADDYAASIRAAQHAERELAATSAIDKKVAEAAKLRQAAEYAKWWGEALDKAVVHERRFLKENGEYETKGAKVREINKRAKELTETYKKLNQTQDQVAASTRRANAELAKNPFQNNGRTTLSLLQRIRGEVLALTGAYVGLQGVISGVASVLDSVRNAQQIQSALLVSNGNDTKAAGDEYKYLRAQAERLGIYLPVLAKQYSQFAVAAKQANLESKDMRFVFERVAEAGKVMNLDNENLNGIFNAITQMVSKGKIQTEELRGQLGDRLPGALQFAAKKYEGGVKEFIKQLEKGNVEAVNGVINLARGLDEAFNKQLEAATRNTVSNEARFKTALDDFKLIIAGAGLEQSYNDLLLRLTEFFKSDEGIAFAKQLGEAFASVANGLIFLIDHLETFQLIIETIVGLFFARQLFNMVVGAKALVDQLIILNKQSKETSGNFASMQKAFVILSAAIASYKLGEALQNEFAIVKKAGSEIAEFLLKTWVIIKYNALIAFEGITSGFDQMFATMANNLTERTRDMLAQLRDMAKAVGADSIASGIDSFIGTLVVKNTEAYESRVKALTNEMQGWLKAIEADTKQSLDYATEIARMAREAANESRNSGATPDPGGNAAQYSSDPESAANKYKALLAQIEAVEASALKKQKESIQSITAGIEKQYEALFRKINASGLEGAAQLQARLRAAVDLLKAEAEKNYGEQELARIESIQKKFAEIEGQLGRSSLGTLDSRLDAIDSKYKSLYADISELDGQRKEDLKAQLDLMISQLKVVEEEKFAQDQLQESQKKINDLITERDARIRTVTDMVTAGLKSESEARELIKSIIQDTQPAIEDSAQSGLELVESLRGIVDDGTLDMLAAKFELARQSANGLKTELYSARQANEDLAAGITGALSETTEGFVDAAFGANSLADAMKNAGRAFVDFAAQFLRKIAEMILQQMILNALQNSSYGGAISGAVSAATAHSGGIAQSVNRSRSVPVAAFANAPRYHTGGLGGFAADELPAVIKKNEEVLTRDDPRHRLNGGLNEQQPLVVPSPQVTVVNSIDAGSFISEGLASKEGDKAFRNYVQANKKSLQVILSSG